MSMDDRIWTLMVAAIGQRIDSPPALALIEAIGAKPLRAVTPRNLYDHTASKQHGLSVTCKPTPKHRPYWPERREKRAYINYITQIMIDPAYTGPLPGGLRWGLSKPELDAIASFELRGSRDIPYWNFEAPGPLVKLAATTSSYALFPEDQPAFDRIWMELDEESDFVSAYAEYEQTKPLVYVEDAFFTVWCGLNGLLDEQRFDAQALQPLRDRSITPLAFLHGPCARLLWSGDVRPQFLAFVALYYNGIGLPDEQRWVSDINKAFAISNHFQDDPTRMTQDDWANYDAIAPLIDERYAQWQRGELKARPRSPG